ncbi:Protocatechuate 3,4-dioxygenase beta subunit [Arachidicoccus rhizosphaerae]|uniref:Protocatechuate 3,4-dioxygenase beta subunit n=1 Tax=Arachidicoccus rhizosphaerae TaxID=551991 RepID=A0A1H3Y0J5_9BACT|nr:intradiol ring-cleavage dioxygenase [Arachidicoccus rhizosphaerae]SEA05245.1 Protocatechuate 3,4-dioxygenase beta subunit [Arachidicoccus rhizosphaerae]
MERKEFLKHSLSALGFVVVAPLIQACSTGSVTEPDNTSGGSVSGSGSATEVTPDTDCKVTPSETEGPFPTHDPASYLRSDLRKGDGVGATLVSTITVVDVNNSCNPLENVYVDIWHCDVNGDYSEYGGSQMQPTDYTELHWLRGRQLTDSNGQVVFTSIFPGWYQSRATHIHAHIFDKSGNSLLVTQIAFQDSLATAVNTDGSDYGYTKGMSGYTYNNADNVFSDGFTQEMSVVSGTLAKGFALSITLHVKA